MTVQSHGVQKERKYIVRLVIGLLIIVVGALSNVFKIAVPTTRQMPNPADIDQMMTVSTGFPPGFMVILGIVLGGGISLYSIYRYSEQTSGTANPAKSRGAYIIIGIALTLLVLVASAYSYYM